MRLIPATTPILMLSGTRDEVVPKKHMEGLWTVAQRRGEDLHDKFESFPGGFHCMCFLFRFFNFWSVP